MNKKENITYWCTQAGTYGHTHTADPVFDSLWKALMSLMCPNHCDKQPELPALSVERMLTAKLTFSEHKMLHIYR